MASPRVEDAIKDQAKKLGAWVVGIARAEDVNKIAPKGHRPADMMRGTKSVVVVGTGVTSAGSWRAPSARVQAAIAYNRTLNIVIAQQLVPFIESNYRHAAMLCPPGSANGRHPYISLKLLAEMAGLGTRSMAAGILLNERHGLLYFGAALTTLELEPDGPLAEPVCPHPACVKLWAKKRVLPCLDSCPTCLDGELEDGAIQWMEYRQSYCLPRAQTSAMASFQKLLLEAMDEPDAQKRKMIVYGNHFSRAVASLGYSAELVGQCFECMRKCPVDMAARAKVT
jgi:hypothetical protein